MGETEFAATFAALAGDRSGASAPAASLVLVAAEPAAVVVVVVVVGYLLMHTRSSFLANGPLAWVEVMVAATHRRHGAGALLMDAAEAWARETGAAYVSWATRRAGPFYRALGYQDSATFNKKSR